MINQMSTSSKPHAGYLLRVRWSVAQRLRSRARAARAPATSTAVVTQYAAGLSLFGRMARDASAFIRSQQALKLPNIRPNQHCQSCAGLHCGVGGCQERDATDASHPRLGSPSNCLQDA